MFNTHAHYWLILEILALSLKKNIKSKNRFNEFRRQIQAIYDDALLTSLMTFDVENTIDDLKKIINLQIRHSSNKEVSDLMSRCRQVQVIEVLAAGETPSVPLNC